MMMRKNHKLGGIIAALLMIASGIIVIEVTGNGGLGYTVGSILGVSFMCYWFKVWKEVWR